MTLTSSLTFQLGDVVEHRGIVVTPLFPARDPVAGYITLDEALPRGLKINETSDAGSVPELAVVNPLDEAVLLYDGEELDRRQAESDPQRLGARRCRCEAADPRLLCRAGPLGPLVGRLRLRGAHFPRAPAPT